MNNITKKEYSKLTDKMSPNSPLLKNLIFAFLIGGGICTLGQLILNLLLNFGLSEDDGKLMVSVILIFLSVFLTGINAYDKIAKIAGAGTIVPITGFANSVAAPAIEFKSEGHVLGIGAKMFVMAGPVLVFGISTSMCYGIILCLLKLVVK